MLFGFINRVSGAAQLREGLDASAARTRGIADRVAKASLNNGDGFALPNAQAGSSYRVFAGEAYGRVKEIVEKIVASALIYLPSSAKDFRNPQIDK